MTKKWLHLLPVFFLAIGMLIGCNNDDPADNNLNDQNEINQNDVDEDNKLLPNDDDDNDNDNNMNGDNDLLPGDNDNGTNRDNDLVPGDDNDANRDNDLIPGDDTNDLGPDHNDRDNRDITDDPRDMQGPRDE